MGCEVVKYDPAARNNFAIRWAASNGHIEVLKYLLSTDSANDNQAIRYAASYGHIEVVKYLLITDLVDQ